MVSFSNITIEEFLRLNSNNIPQELLDYFDAAQEKVASLQKELESEQRSSEIAWEQVSFARDLVEMLDSFAKDNLSKAKQKMYNQIRENTYFEV